MAVPYLNPQEYAINFRRQPIRSRGLEVRKSSAHSPRSRNQQPRASDAHPCTALSARRRGTTVQLESRTSFTLPLVLYQPIHTLRQQPARKKRQLATGKHTIAAGSMHTTVPLERQPC